MVKACVASWRFSENSIKKTTARKEEKKKTEENVFELVTENKWKNID